MDRPSINRRRSSLRLIIKSRIVVGARIIRPDYASVKICWFDQTSILPCDQFHYPILGRALRRVNVLTDIYGYWYVIPTLLTYESGVFGAEIDRVDEETCGATKAQSADTQRKAYIMQFDRRIELRDWLVRAPRV